MGLLYCHSEAISKVTDKIAKFLRISPRELFVLIWVSLVAEKLLKHFAEMFDYLIKSLLLSQNVGPLDFVCIPKQELLQVFCIAHGIIFWHC